VRKKIFLYWADYRAAKAGQNSFVPAWRAQRTNKERTTFICTLGIPICLSFNTPQRPPLSIVSLTIASTIRIAIRVKISKNRGQRFKISPQHSPKIAETNNFLCISYKEFFIFYYCINHFLRVSCRKFNAFFFLIRMDKFGGMD
jgi:hypothetical protein